MWLTFSILGYAILAVVAIMDKFLLSQTRLSSALYTFYSTIFVLPIFFLLPLGVKWPASSLDWMVIIVSGFSFGLALWAMFIGFEQSEVSHLGPLIGATTPLFSLLLSRYFLGEILSARALIACGFLMIGSLIVSFEQTQRHSGWHRGIWFGCLAGFLFAVSNVSAKYVYDDYGFFSGLIWTRGMIGVFGVLLLFYPAVYRGFFKKSLTLKIKDKLLFFRRSQNNLVLVGVDKILGMLGVLIIQYAIASGSVALVNALNGLQYAFLIIFVFLLSRFWPRVFKEDYAVWEIFQEILAVIIIFIGLILLVTV